MSVAADQANPQEAMATEGGSVEVLTAQVGELVGQVKELVELATTQLAVLGQLLALAQAAAPALNSGPAKLLGMLSGGGRR